MPEPIDLPVQPELEQPSRRRKRWPWITGAAAVVVAVAVAAFVLVETSGKFSVRGTITLTDTSTILSGLNPNYQLPTAGTSCVARSGLDDVDEGAQVVVTGSNGDTLAIGKLSAGVNDGGAGDAILRVNHCVFSFTVSGIPEGKGPYAVEIAHRGKVNFTEVDAKQPLALMLGG